MVALAWAGSVGHAAMRRLKDSKSSAAGDAAFGCGTVATVSITVIECGIEPRKCCCGAAERLHD